MSTLLDAPIPATLHGVPVRVYGITPDGRILVAHADGRTETTIWESLRVPSWGALAPATVDRIAANLARLPSGDPLEPWGEWVEALDRDWGRTWTRWRNSGTEDQCVRIEYGTWTWRWGIRSGSGFPTPEAAREACEAYTVSAEWTPAPTPADGSPEPATFDDAGAE